MQAHHHLWKATSHIVTELLNLCRSYWTDTYTHYFISRVYQPPFYGTMLVVYSGRFHYLHSCWQPTVHPKWRGGALLDSTVARRHHSAVERPLEESLLLD